MEDKHRKKINFRLLYSQTCLMWPSKGTLK